MRSRGIRGYVKQCAHNSESVELGHRVKATGMPGMAASYTTHGQQYATNEAVTCQRFLGVFGTGWMITTGSPKIRADRYPINSDSKKKRIDEWIPQRGHDGLSRRLPGNQVDKAYDNPFDILTQHSIPSRFILRQEGLAPEFEHEVEPA